MSPRTSPRSADASSSLASIGEDDRGGQPESQLAHQSLIGAAGLRPSRPTPEKSASFRLFSTHMPRAAGNWLCRRRPISNRSSSDASCPAISTRRHRAAVRLVPRVCCRARVIRTHRDAARNLAAVIVIPRGPFCIYRGATLPLTSHRKGILRATRSRADRDTSIADAARTRCIFCRCEAILVTERARIDAWSRSGRDDPTFRLAGQVS